LADYAPPSRLRIPLSLLCGLAVPPLGVIAWIALSGSRRSDYLRSNWVRTGLGIGVGSAFPLLIVGSGATLGLGSDPDPNPIGLGLLALAGGILGTVLMAVGIALASRRGP
jgi:hypothetical protein